MQKNTLMLIIFLSVVTVFLILIAIRYQPPKTLPVQPQPTPTIIEKTSSVYFLPDNISAVLNKQMTADIFVDTNAKPITGVQVELAFDPKVVRNVKINPPSSNVTSASNNFFGGEREYSVLFKEVNQNSGRVSYAIAITPTSAAKTGVGKVAELSFSVVSSAASIPNQGSSIISFTEKTMVTSEGITESVLKDTKPLTITLSPQ